MSGMTISARGVLERAAQQCERSRDNKHLAFPLRHLLENLDELYRRRDEPEILASFFSTWRVPSMDETLATLKVR